MAEPSDAMSGTRLSSEKQDSLQHGLQARHGGGGDDDGGSDLSAAVAEIMYPSERNGDYIAEAQRARRGSRGGESGSGVPVLRSRSRASSCQEMALQDDDGDVLSMIERRESRSRTSSRRRTPSRSRSASRSRAGEAEGVGPAVARVRSSLSEKERNAIYAQYTTRTKWFYVFIVSYCSLLAPFATTSIFPATPEIASSFDTTGVNINITNAGFLIVMGFAAMMWGPVSQIYGRWPIYAISSSLYTVGNLCCALTGSFGGWIFCRYMLGFAGSAFLAVGAGTIGDIFPPVRRGLAMGIYLSGTLIGPALSPVIAGVIVQFRPWRVIFWLQMAMGIAAWCLCIFCLRETAHVRGIDIILERRQEQWKQEHGPEAELPRARKIVWVWFNPFSPLVHFRYPGLAAMGFVSSVLLFNMYQLLTPIRYVMNPRFHLTSPALAGLFYLAPGMGYLTGTYAGGRYADHTVKSWMRRRGYRRPEDRLRSALVALGLVIPSSVLIYGWCLEYEKGGIPVPVIMLFLSGIAQIICFASINTYCVDIMPKRAPEVVAGNYCVRYFLAAAASGCVLPMINHIGIGWTCTVSALLTLIGAGLTLYNVVYGERLRLRIDEAQKRRRAQREDSAGH